MSESALTVLSRARKPRTRSWLARPDLSLPPFSRPSSTKGRALLSVATLGVQGGLRLVMGVALARIMGAGEYGMFVTATSLAAFVGILWPGSTGLALTRFAGRLQGEGRLQEAARVGTVISRRAIFSSVVAAGSTAAVWSVWQSDGWLETTMMAVLTFGMSLQLFGRACNLLVGNYLREAFWGILTTSVGVAGAVVAVTSGASLGYVLLPLAVGYVLYAGVSVPLRSWRAGLRRVPEVDRYVSVAALGSVASAGFMQVSVIAVMVLGGSVEAGQFGVAVALSTPIALTTAAGAMLINPALARCHGAGDEVGTARIWRQAGRYYGASMVVVLAVFALSGQPLMVLLFGNEYRGSVTVAMLLMTGVALSGFSTGSVSVLSMGRIRNAQLSTLYAWVGAVLGVAVWGVAASDVSHISVVIATGFLVARGGAAIANIFRAARLLGQSLPVLWILMLLAPTVFHLILHL